MIRDDSPKPAPEMTEARWIYSRRNKAAYHECLNIIYRADLEAIVVMGVVSFRLDYASLETGQKDSADGKETGSQESDAVRVKR